MPNSPETLSNRITRLETMMEALAHQMTRDLEMSNKVNQNIEKSIEKMSEILASHDQRLDKFDVLIAKAVGAIAVFVMIANLLAPWFQKLLGITGNP